MAKLTVKQEFSTEWLYKKRTDMGYSLRQLSDRIGIPFATLGAWERGARKPKIEQVERLQSFFNKSIGYADKALEDYEAAEQRGREIENAAWVMATGYKSASNYFDAKDNNSVEGLIRKQAVSMGLIESDNNKTYIDILKQLLEAEEALQDTEDDDYAYNMAGW
ncbi:MAG: helix-turn-helix transcriptional regulator [Leuconostoc pseudomesenteroides]|uniref:helix-turn-helix domain-containing protein n=1 Tax=Leuconostoc pseudomesenteroides TaxID=33968 RepID=UPI001E65BF0B|nr:helix-turn-helix transcriptional regulator [Leuconostoc pseudomesenteroides]MCC7668928.1 hypothetical protein [Leuconostoc pseudomesenteroides]